MGMVNTESSRPFKRLVVPITRHAASNPSTPEKASAHSPVLRETHKGR